jgi:ABC-2 type transport system ATP-binding protein
MSHAIELRSVTQRFRKVTALDDVSVTLEGGRIHGLLGRNGSGKTTLLSIAAAYRKPTAGQALVGGQPVFENPAITPQVCLIRGSGDTVEHDWPEDRVKHALRFASRMWPTWDDDYATKLIDRFEVDVDSRLGELSRGQRSAVGVVLGLASRAPVTLLDESYLGMDAPARYTFYDELLADFMEHPRTFVISTHLIGEVSRLFDHVTIIDHGRVLVHDDAEALRQRGFEVTGPADAVDRFAADHEVLAERQLGGTKAVTIHGDLDAVQRREAADDGLEVGPISLQDLFVHLTRSTGGRP